MHNFYRQYSMPPPPTPPPSRRAPAQQQQPTHYDTLGVPQTASADEIKRAFRAASLKLHPDRNPGDPTATAKFQSITAAYNVLSDPQKRAMYDAELSGGGADAAAAEMEDFMAFMMSMMPPRGNGRAAAAPPAGFIFVNPMGGGAAHAQPNADELEELFGQMFGGAAGMASHATHHPPTPPTTSLTTAHPQQQQQTYIPDPLAMTLEITMQDVFLGAQMPVQITRRVSKSRHARITATEQETVYVDVYRGIDDGEIITIAAKGDYIEGVYGDVKITIRVANTTEFKRKGLDLIYVKRIGLREALGGEFEFDLKLLDDNTCTIKNKRGAVIEPNLCKTYTGMGLVRKEQKGNLIIRFIVEFPAAVTEDQLGHIAAAFG